MSADAVEDRERLIATIDRRRRESARRRIAEAVEIRMLHRLLHGTLVFGTPVHLTVPAGALLSRDGLVRMFDHLVAGLDAKQAAGLEETG